MYGREEHVKDRPVFLLAQAARRTLTLNERRFQEEVKARFPKVSWRRYHPVTIKVHEQGSTWYAPFLCVEKKVVVVVEGRKEFPYTLSGRNYELYAKHGYTILDFTEDGPEWDEKMWDDAMGGVRKGIQ